MRRVLHKQSLIARNQGLGLLTQGLGGRNRGEVPLNPCEGVSNPALLM